MKKERKRKKEEQPPLYDGFPTSMKIREDPVTHTVIPTNQQVEDVKKWVDFNTK